MVGRFGDRILILAPHPDDEVVACGAAIAQARAEGAAVAVLFLTHGCVSRETLWPWDRRRYDAIVGRRHAEAQAAALALGVTIAGVAARLAAEGLRVLEFAEYNFAGGRARSQDFPSPNGTEEVLSLSVAERAAKRAALGLYRSERRNLTYVRCEREVFRPLTVYDYSRPPHAGKLWYARFQWVPFRHPDVDFTDPAEVTAALSTYLGATGKRG